MQHISRIYIGNYGHKMCWYDGLLMSFLDQESGLPCDHIIHLENGGGKSTLLGGIFSCFEPRQDRFLKTLHDPRNRFSEYFREDGVPGFIVVEWQNHLEANKAPRRIVTGQAVAIKNTLTHELERVFFHFESGGDLTLESLPVPKLSDTPVQSIREFSSWLNKMQTKHRGNLYSTRNQNEWERNVEAERGIDIGLLKQQLEFSRQEGAVDAFLNFKNEAEFLRKLLGLTMDQERAMSVRDSIALACDRLRDKPKHERRAKILRECENVLNLFGDAAHTYEQVREDYASIQQNALLLAFSLQGRIAKRRQELDLANQQHFDLTGRWKDENQRRTQLSKSLLGARFEELRRALEDAKTTNDSAQQDVQLAEKGITLLKAARVYTEVLSGEQRLNELTQLDAKAREEMAPFTQEANRAGSILKEILKRAIEDLKAREVKLSAQADEARNQAAQIDLELRRLFEVRTGLERELSKLESLEEQHQAERNRLSKIGIFQHAEEAVANASTRLESGLKSALQESDLQEHLLNDLEKKSEVLQGQVTDLNKRHAQGENELRQVRQELSSGENLRAELSQDETLCHVLATDLVDPELPELQERLSSAMLQLRQEGDLHAVTLARLNSFRTEFENTGLAQANPDVMNVIRHLSEAGVRSAIPFNQYLAQVFPDAEQARLLIKSDPARFLGVGLQDESELSLARKILPDQIDISQPVVISATTQSASPQPNLLVVSPATDAAFNFEAAARFAQELSDSIAREQIEAKQCSDRLDRLHRTQAKLAAFQEQFGKGRLGQLADNANQLKNNLEVIEGQLRRLGAEIEEAKALAVAAKTKIKELTGQIKELEMAQHQLKQFAERIEAPWMAGRERLKQIRSDIEGVKTATENAEESKSKQLNSCEEKRLAAQQLSHEAENFKRESNEIVHADAQCDAPQYLAQNNITLGAARDLYRDQRKILETEEERRLGLLAVQIDVCRKELTKTRESYEREYGKLDSDSVSEAARTTENIDEALAAITAKLTNLIEVAQQLRDAWILAQNQFKQYKKANPESEEYAAQFTDAFDADQLKSEITRLQSEHEICSQAIAELDLEMLAIAARIPNLSHEIDLLGRSHAQLAQSLDDQDLPGIEIEIDDSNLSPDPAEIDRAVVLASKEIKRVTREKDASFKIVEKHFRDVQSFASRPEVLEAEQALSGYLTQNNLSDSIANADELKNAIKQRIAAVESVLATLDKDFAESLEELVNLVGEGLHVLTTACSKRLPENAPYIGGKPVLRMRAAFPPSHAEARRQVLSSYMNSIIESGFPHKTGTDMVADAVLQVANGSVGIQIVKLIRDPSEQYVAVNKLSNSGGEAVSMAMFLYLLIARVRADMQAKVRRQVGGPLILDNPFAKATSSFIWRAQRDLARSLGVQLVIATALPDYNALGEFDHFIRLRKAGQHDKTGRWHIEQSEFSFVN